MRIAALYLENANFHRRHIPIPVVWKESTASLCHQTEPQRILVVCDNTEAKTLHVMRQTKGSCLHRQRRRPRPQSCPSVDRRPRGCIIITYARAPNAVRHEFSTRNKYGSKKVVRCGLWEKLLMDETECSKKYTTVSTQQISTCTNVLYSILGDMVCTSGF